MHTYTSQYLGGDQSKKKNVAICRANIKRSENNIYGLMLSSS